MEQTDVVIIGAGLAGLACAQHLHEAGVDILVLEASHEVGGRVRTEIVEGFRLDHGFQVLLEAYPEACRLFDYEALALRRFASGSLVRFGGRFHRLADPWRAPVQALAAAFSPIGTMRDKWQVLRLRRELLRTGIEEIFSRPETTTLEALRKAGMSSAFIERFFRPFLAGIFLDRELSTSSRMFEFVFKMFSAGAASLPADGMQELPRQLAARLDPSSLRFEAHVAEITDQGVVLRSGESIRSRIVVVATGARQARAWVSGLPAVDFVATTCLYFAAPRPPVAGPWLVLNGDSEGPINNLCVPSEVSPRYAPEDYALVSVTVLGGNPDPPAREAQVWDQLRSWFGDQVESWHLLRSFQIDEALTRQQPGVLEPAERPVTFGEDRFVCGDHRDHGSIQGALTSGRRTAEAILATSSKGRVTGNFRGPKS